MLMNTAMYLIISLKHIRPTPNHVLFTKSYAQIKQYPKLEKSCDGYYAATLFISNLYQCSVSIKSPGIH